MVLLQSKRYCSKSMRIALLAASISWSLEGELALGKQHRDGLLQGSLIVAAAEIQPTLPEKQLEQN
jgi:hypothetical protein